MTIYAMPAGRILEGLAQSLADEVAPHVSDDYALGQLRTAIEVLRNLEHRVRWAPERIVEQLAAARTAMHALGCASPATAAEPSPELLRATRAVLGEHLAEVYRPPTDPAAVTAAWHAARAEFDAEREAIRTGALGTSRRDSTEAGRS